MLRKVIRKAKPMSLKIFAFSAQVITVRGLITVEISPFMKELRVMSATRTMDEMVGRADRLEMRPALDHWKARGLDFSRILALPDVQDAARGFCERTAFRIVGIEPSQWGLAWLSRS